MRNEVPLAGYHPIAKLLHWGTVPLIIAQFGLALAMSDNGQHRTPDRAGILHMSTGVLILGITLGRLAWRLRFPPDVSTRGAGDWKQLGARAVHLSIYGLLIFLPLSGMLLAHFRGWAVGFFGMPMLSSSTSRPHATLAHGVATMHAMAAVILLSALGLHLLGVSYHLLWCKDGVVQRMLPASFGRRPRRKAAARS